ncbi:hypothetical protein ASPBRDRAFT_132240 [Aspergillus brasiliensis CBS 101740]|uniref:Heterokaryon incompatibility domain-containing protein n=1 Tax=Aspergillus brasiliensis (strain CBS 101740 / IMI 381727 / IBT 21946) TaxID=767769 RepID=A0A1L9UAU4_ASPBC|nr:hypothetical protein ASPBRDRAFT_132240 [Aspergillus brasiliensis CBS 101740]
MSSYDHPPLPRGSYTRMIDLLPDRERSAPIRCKVFSYNLSDRTGSTHLYEALSYTWGSGLARHSIIVNGYILPVTENLHTALLYLRDHQLVRTLWVDAICINQKDNDEKANQIPFMQYIYANADRVIVWLGEPDRNGGDALETIRRLAEHKALMRLKPRQFDHLRDDAACQKLLRNDWFRRIWVLQEVGVARCITVQLGLTKIDGYAFCEGVGSLDVSLLPEYILPVISLIQGSIFRSRNATDLPGILSIGELIDMYHSHSATVPHDKIYALLGLCSDDPETPCLKPNYHLTYDEVVEQVAHYVFGRECAVAILPGTQTAVIRGMGWILGHIVSVERNDSGYCDQVIQVSYHKTALGKMYQSKWANEWILRPSALPIQEYDVVCLLQGALWPTIVRLGKSQVSVVMSTVASQNRTKWKHNDAPLYYPSEQTMSRIQPQDWLPVDFILTWDVFQAHTRRSKESRQSPNPHSIQSNCLELGRQHILEDVAFHMLGETDLEGQIELLKHLLSQSLTKIPVSERVLQAAAAAQTTNCDLSSAVLLGEQKNLPLTEISVEAATTLDDLMRLLFYRDHSEKISEQVVLAAISNPEGSNILETFYAYQEELPISVDVVKFAAGRFIGSLSPRRYFEFVSPLLEGKIHWKAHPKVFWEHGKRCLDVMYRHQTYAVLEAVRDPEMGDMIKRMLREIEVERGPMQE